MKAKKRVALEIGEDGLAVCEASFQGNGARLRIMASKLDCKTTGAAAEGIGRLFRTYDVGTKGVSLVIPRHLVVTKTMKFPSIDEKEIDAMIRVEAARESPYADGGVIMSYRLIDRRPDGYSDVMAVMAQAEVVTGYLSMLKEAGLGVERIALSSEALLAWRRLAQKEDPKMGEAAAIINIDQSYADIVIAEGERLLSSRAFTYLPGPGGLESKLIDNVRLILHMNRKEKGAVPRRIVVTGVGDRVKLAAAILRDETGIETEIVPQMALATVVDPGSCVRARSFASLAGICLGGASARIDLLPASVAKANELRELKASAGKTAVLVGCAALFLVSAATKNAYDKTRYIGVIDSQLSAVRGGAAEAKAVMDDIDVVKRDTRGLPFAIELIDEIYRRTPPNIAFTLLDCQPSGVFTFRGGAPSLDDTVKFMRQIESSPYFREAKLQHTVRRQEGGKDVVDFEITCSVAHQ